MNNDAIKNELKNKLPALAVNFQPLPSLAAATAAHDNRSRSLQLMLMSDLMFQVGFNRGMKHNENLSNDACSIRDYSLLETSKLKHIFMMSQRARVVHVAKHIPIPHDAALESFVQSKI